MHSSFSDWYRAIRIKPDPDELNRRWQIVETLYEKLKLGEALNVLRIAARLPQVNQSYQGDLVGQIQELDPTFGNRNRQQELSVLSGAMLVELLSEKESQLAGQVGLAVSVANCRGIVSAKLPHQQELLKKAYELVESRAHWLRTTDESEFKVESIKGLDKVVTTFLEGVGWQGDPHKKNFNAVFSQLKAVIEKQSAQIKKLNYDLRIQREETNFLWWLHGEFSRDLDKPIAELDARAAAVVIGKELADLTDIRPGPRSVRGVLHRMLQKNAPYRSTKKTTDTVTLGDAINATPREWREQWISDLSADTVIDLCHVHHAAKKSLQVAVGKAWAASFDTAAPIKTTQKFSPLELAVQVYHEAQLIAEVED